MRGVFSTSGQALTIFTLREFLFYIIPMRGAPASLKMVHHQNDSGLFDAVSCRCAISVSLIWVAEKGNMKMRLSGPRATGEGIQRIQNSGKMRSAGGGNDLKISPPKRSIRWKMGAILDENAFFRPCIGH